MANEPVSNAFANYDNKVEASKKGKSFLSKLMGNLSSAVSSFAGPTIKNLNKLAAFKSGKFDLNALLSKAGKSLKSLSKQGLNMLKDMTKDAISNLANASLSFAMNIVEDFVNNIKKSLYMPDEMFVAELKTLYYAGADLAYHNHYIRKMALKRDWSKTLEFVDDEYVSHEYAITYKLEYKNLNSDLATCTDNSCWKNVYYIFGKLYDQYNSIKSEYNTAVYSLNTYYATKEAQALNPTEYKNLVATSTAYKNSMNSIEDTMLTHFKNLITYSYTYLNVAALKQFFDKYGEILKPKYFGQTDDKYNKKYVFNASDVAIMMPFHTQNTTTTADQITKQTEALNNKIVSDDIATSTSSDTDTSKLNKNLSKCRTSLYEKQKKRSSYLTATALNKGSQAVLNATESRYDTNSDGVVVKYYKNGVREGARNLMKDDKKYIDLRNKNIKQIYVYLSSEVIFSTNRMVNSTFSQRCTYESSNSYNESLSKMRGILGQSYLVQSIFDVSDAIDASGYKFLLKQQDFLFDPRVNVPIDSFTDQYNNFIQSGSELDDVLTEVKKYQSESTKSNTSNSTISSSSTDTTGISDSYVTVNSTDTPNDLTKRVTDTLEDELDSDPITSAKLSNIFKFLSEITMVMKRDIIIKYLTYYYNNLINSKVPKDIVETKFAALIFNLFGYSGYKNPDNIIALFDYATNDSIDTVLRNMIIVYKLGKIETFINLKNTKYRKVLSKVYNIVVSILIREIQSTGFARTVYNYDQDYLQSLTKQTFNGEISYLDTIKALDNPMHKNFYPSLDNLTKQFTGFNRQGIFGYDCKNKRIKYTNYDYGDWNDVRITEENGTFICGNEFTSSFGIKRLNVDKDEFIDTNVSDGTWVIYDLNKITFFVNVSTNVIKRWDSNSSKLVDTNGSFKDSNLILLPNKLILLVSTTNIGISYWDTDTNSFIQVDTIGGNFSYKEVKNGYFVYSKTNNSSYAYIADNKKLNKLSNIKAAITSFIEYESVITINGTYLTTTTTTSTETSGSSSSGSTTTQISTPVTEVCNVYNIVASGPSDIYHAFVLSKTHEYKSAMESETLNNFHNYKCDISIMYPNSSSYLFKRPTNKVTIGYKGGYDTNSDGTIDVKDNYNSSGINADDFIDWHDIYNYEHSKGNDISESDAQLMYLENNKLSNVIQANFRTSIVINIGILSTYDHSTFDPTTYVKASDVQNQVFKNFTLLEASSSDKDALGITKVWQTSIGLFYTFDNKLRYYNPNQPAIYNTIIALPSDSITTDLDTFEFNEYHNSTIMFAESEKEIMYFNPSNKTLTQILTASDRLSGWKVHELISKYDSSYHMYLSNIINSKGIRFYNFNINSAIKVNLDEGKWFINITDNNFFAMSTSGYNNGIRISNINNINFDNLEVPITTGNYSASDYDNSTKRLYICTLRENCLTKPKEIVYDLDEFIYPLNIYTLQKLVINFNSKKFDNILDSILSMLLSDSLFINNDILNDDGSSNSDITIPDGKYTLDDIMSLLATTLASVDSFLTNAIASSGVFADLLTYSQAQLEFGINDEKSLQNLQATLMLLYSVDGSVSDADSANKAGIDANGTNFTDILARYKAYMRKMYIVNNTTLDGKTITTTPGSKEWNIQNDKTTDDFIDSDELTYQFIPTTQPITYDYIVFDMAKSLKSGTVEFMCRSKGVSIFTAREMGLAKTKNYYPTTFEAEDLLSESRTVYIRQKDYDIMKTYI